ncbi:glycosyltransferase family 2 protein [Streptomyces sp. NBC_01478]|uniref:glycosyltransferase family 2 protein n=1 Tax=Streptomyces sp. NBC_01478 TaxID=2903882 RepID=UPI002E346B31|nr:glycosyltransferase family 2 protein [Streptomyces sp. NBC_01478]
MGGPKISVVIPYKQRLRNFRVALAALAEQTLPGSEFEIVVGALEYSPEYLEVCREYAGRLTVVSVLVDEEWNLCRSRNLALRQVSGEVVVFLDADLALPPRCLETLYDRYYADGQERCVVGRIVGLDGRSDRAAETADLPEHRRFRTLLADLEAAPGECHDKRWRFDPFVLPWTLVWGAFIVIPAASVRRHGLLFDEDFHGWGGEDQEWGYRVHAAGIPIVRGENVFGLHLPHMRDVSTNFREFDVNMDHFLTKWPALDVELFRAYDMWGANRRYEEARSEIAAIVPGPDGALGVARGTVAGRDTLVVGVPLTAPAGRPAEIADPAVRGLFETVPSVLPLVGLALPFAGGSVEECRVLPAVLRLSERYRETVLREAARVARHVVTAAESVGPAA